MAKHVPITPRPTAIVIPFGKAKADRGPNAWAHPDNVEGLIHDAAQTDPAHLLAAAYVSLNFATMPSTKPDLQLRLVLRVVLLLTRLLDEAGFPVVLAEARS